MILEFPSNKKTRPLFRFKKDWFLCCGVHSVSVPTPASTNIIYVSPTGSGTGLTEDDPMDFQTALSGTITAGYTIMMLDGTYVGHYTITISGDVTDDIIIRAKNYWQAKIDGGIDVGDNTGINGCYITIRGIEIYDSETDRGTGVEPAGTFVRNNSLNIWANNVSVISNLLHDGGLGITAYRYADTFVCYGNIIYNFGAYEIGGAGQCIYFHSTNKIIKHNIIGGSFRKSVAIYTTNATIENITLEENVIFSSGTVLAGGDASDGQVISESLLENHILNNGIQLGYTMTPNILVTCNNNRIYGDNPLTASYFQYLEIKNNKFFGQEASGNGCYELNYTTEKINYDIDGNEYRNLGGSGNVAFHDGINGNGDFATWQTWGYDVTGSYAEVLPVVNETFVYANEYPDDDDPRMGVVVIWNWEGLNEVNVNLSDLGLVINGSYRWRQAQDPLVDIDTFMYERSGYSFPMTGHTVAKPTGVDIELVETQFPTFGCFIIEKV